MTQPQITLRHSVRCLSDAKIFQHKHDKMCTRPSSSSSSKKKREKYENNNKYGRQFPLGCLTDTFVIVQWISFPIKTAKYIMRYDSSSKQCAVSFSSIHYFANTIFVKHTSPMYKNQESRDTHTAMEVTVTGRWTITPAIWTNTCDNAYGFGKWTRRAKYYDADTVDGVIRKQKKNCSQHKLIWRKCTK